MYRIIHGCCIISIIESMNIFVGCRDLFHAKNSSFYLSHYISSSTFCFSLPAVHLLLGLDLHTFCYQLFVTEPEDSQLPQGNHANGLHPEPLNLICTPTISFSKIQFNTVLSSKSRSVLANKSSTKSHSIFTRIDK